MCKLSLLLSPYYITGRTLEKKDDNYEREEAGVCTCHQNNWKSLKGAYCSRCLPDGMARHDYYVGL
jgi:hypothetical protein